MPLDFGKPKTIAVIGAFAKRPRYQGAGSSQVNPTRVSTAYDELVKLAGQEVARSVMRQATPTRERRPMICSPRPRSRPKGHKLPLVFAGLPDSFESEGFDRSSLDLPAGHNQLIEAVSAVQPNVVVVLMNGSAVTMPWANKVKAIVEAWLGGQAGGGAIADALTGKDQSFWKAVGNLSCATRRHACLSGFSGPPQRS